MAGLLACTRLSRERHDTWRRRPPVGAFFGVWCLGHRCSGAQSEKAPGRHLLQERRRPSDLFDAARTWESGLFVRRVDVRGSLFLSHMRPHMTRGADFPVCSPGSSIIRLCFDEVAKEPCRELGKNRRSSFCYHRFLCRLLLALRGAGNANFVKIAREKLVSFSAEDALAPGQHSTSPEPPSASPDCGNFKKKMPSKIKNANNEIANSPPLAIKNVVTKTSSSGSGSGPSTPRGNKTLGWFLSETLMEKEATPAAPESEAGSNASEGEKKKSRRGGGKQRGKKIAVECILPKKNPTCVGADSYSTLSPEEKVPSGNKEQSKEDYWYYDPVSDGFYYEQNGSRGWRKRMPANATLSQRPLKPLDSAEKMATQTPQTQNTPVVSAQYFTPSIKYYDAVSDGYFYEMASVDGWKKRQPASSSQSSTSSSSAPVEREGSLPSHGNPMFEDSEDKSTLSLANIPPYLKNNYKNPMDMVVYQNNIEKPNSIASSSSFSDEPANYYWPKSSDEALSAPDPAKPFTLPLADDSDSESSSSSRLYNFNVDKFIEDMNFNTCGLDVDSLISDMSAMKTPCNEGPGLGKCSAPSVWSWGDTASLTVPCEVPSVLPGLSNDIRKIWASGV
ncbi:hypothetical protein QR680_005531 [Steinernema hermaphroditum]|uniref:Uncharacterized protein n=1 Tax=Steinernema hermaphroditum TaxID=289476 RepID=A0AA39HTF2_9BILA|nr:hypothetical protein QR680_005531 [Steinernema hermaphroditum]